MARMLVTGGCGFIGSHIVEATCPHHEVVVLDDLHTGSMDNIAPFVQRHGVRLLRHSVLDADALRQAMEGVETVFHLAALISVPQSMQQAVRYVETNTIGTLRVLEAASRAGVRNLVFSSSAAVYGETSAAANREDAPPDPRSPYAVTKLDGEQFCALYRREHGLNAVALRYFNVFGPRQNPASAYAAAIPFFIHRALRGEPLPVHGDGEQTRDFIHVHDVVRANLAAARLGGDVINVARGEALSINHLVAVIRRLTASSSAILHEAPRAGDVRHSLADVTRLRDQLQCLPATELEEGLAATIRDSARRLGAVKA